MKPELACASCVLTWPVEKIAVSGHDCDCNQVTRSISKMLADESEGKEAIFMLKPKCGPFARKVGLAPGSFVVRLVK